MKTLNEILNDKYEYLSFDWKNKTTKEAIEAVKEWLTQKRQEPKYQVTTLHLYNKQSTEQELFNELLEELQEE